MKKRQNKLTAFLCLALLIFTCFADVLPTSAATVQNGSYVKADNENNPLVTQNYGADPGVMVYNGRVYVYTTNDTQEFAGNNENTYGKITQINCYSSNDMVNWTDHGYFEVAGSNGAAKWASNSWAPCAAHKTINGKEQFFLYFANNGGGIGVLTSDSPTGPWKDPVGRALITGSTPGCSGVVWMFDPAVLVDTDGSAYLYFGGGVPTGQAAHPKTARVIKLDADMISTVGSAATIDAPYLFEDSGINKIGNTYYYSYCSNWNCANGFSNAAIEYMTSSSPMGPFTYQGEIMKNPGVFFSGSTGNNHHSIFEFNGDYYMAYHTRAVESKIIGKSLGYRTTQIDKLSVTNGKINSLTPTMTGISAGAYVNPYENVQAETIFTQSGINVKGYGNGVAYVTNIHTGDFTELKGCYFKDGLSKITVSVRSSGNGSIDVRDGGPNGTKLGTINVSNTNGEFKWFSGSMANVSSYKTICFVYNGSFDFDLWYANKAGDNSSAPSTNTNTNTGSNTTTQQTVEANLLNTYGKTFGYSGTCINLYQLKDANTLNIVKKHFNSVTLENEMKPDALLGSSAKLISVSEAKNRGYYIPSNYTESYVPQINFTTVDAALKICADNGLKMRGHTLVWHSQTPSWFFRNGYNGGSSFVSPSTMDARMEMYIKTVMNHVYTGEYADVVYAWDVANEYLHATNSGWEAVYGKNGTSPAFLQKAFTYAKQTIDYFKRSDVKLFYNDYNTYMGVNDTIALVNYINKNGKVCDGVGMQSHLGTTFPSVDYYTTALKSFLNAGFEVQITEMDITNKGDTDLANYSYSLYKNINSLKKNGGKITGVTWWGLSDQTTWISNAAPLLFSRPDVPKSAYYKVIQAYTETFGQPTVTVPGSNNTGSNTNTGSNSNTGSSNTTPSTPTNNGSTAKIADGWYYLKNTLSQKYLTVEGNKGGNNVNVFISTGTGVAGQKWYVTNTEDGYITLTSKLGSYNLDVTGGRNEDGANMIIYNAYAGNPQKFQAKTTSANGVYTIVTKASNGTKALDVYNHGKEDGTNVCQWTFYGNPNQQWQFEKINDTTTPGTTENNNNNNNNNNQTQQPEQTQPQQPTTPASSMTLEKTVNSWGSGYTANFKVVNNTGAQVNTWTLKLKKSEIKIESSWNVDIKTSGDYYVITPLSWNASIPNKGSIEFGVVGSGSLGNLNYSFQ